MSIASASGVDYGPNRRPMQRNVAYQKSLKELASQGVLLVGHLIDLKKEDLLNDTVLQFALEKGEV